MKSPALCRYSCKGISSKEYTQQFIPVNTPMPMNMLLNSSENGLYAMCINVWILETSLPRPLIGLEFLMAKKKGLLVRDGPFSLILSMRFYRETSIGGLSASKVHKQSGTLPFLIECMMICMKTTGGVPYMTCSSQNSWGIHKLFKLFLKNRSPPPQKIFWCSLRGLWQLS